MLGKGDLMQDINIGQKIMEFRKDKNLTIKDLAIQTGLTSSLLSQIERSLANPSINSLKIIAKNLEVPLFLFFMQEPDLSTLLVRKDERKKIEFPDSSNITYELLSPNFEGQIEFANMILSSGAYSSKNQMEHDGEEVALVTRGNVNLHIGKEILTLSNGDSIKIPPKMMHKWVNPFIENADVIFARTPPTF